jgi:hypothetical protein
MDKNAVSLSGWFLLFVLVFTATEPAAAWGLKDVLDKAKETVEATANTVTEAVTNNKQEDKVEAENKEFSVAKDAAEGAVLCGGLAHLLDKSKSTVTKAAVACGAANAAITVLANQGKKEYAEQYTRITNDMVESEQEIASLEKETKANDIKVDAYQSKVKQLIAGEKDDKAFIAKANDLREELDAQVRANKKARSKAEAKVAVLDQQVADLDTIIKDSPDIDDLSKTRVALLEQKSRLTDSVKQANGMNDELLAQTSLLDSAIIERS